MSTFQSDDGSVRLLVISQFFPPESMGGAHRWEKLSKNLSENVEARVLCPPPTFPYGEFDRDWTPYAQDEINDIPVTRLWTWQPKDDDRIVGRVLNYGVFAVLATLYVLLNWWRFDVVVTMSAPHTTYLPGVVSKLMGRRWVVDIFDLWLDNAADLGYVDEDSLQYRFVNMLEYSSMHISDKIFVITETMCEFYLEKYPEVHEEKIEIIPFGVNTELFSPDTNTTNNGSDIIYTGNLGTGQAFIPFLEAFAELDLNLTLSIVGDGERREELEKLVESLDIEDRVTFVGLVPREEIPERLSSAKVSLVPLKTEHSLDYARPNKMLEAMAVGTSYIASSVKEITKISEQRNTGVATCNERLTIKDAMETLIQNPELREEMGENGIKVINEEHDWEVIGQRATNSISKLVRE